jgi:uncharacterized protein (DUF2126 family)
MLTYWQHHPGLSYLFSGRFIGPTSQAPRVDEGRTRRSTSWRSRSPRLDRLAGLPEPRPWQVDRALRHLLTDITGNTHRSEFCIDKLYSPDSERGRLGLLELRGFEMPPHPTMALVQALLVRRWSRGSGPSRTPGRWCAGGPACTTEFLLPTFVRPTSPTWSTTCGPTARLRPGVAGAVLRVPLPARSAPPRSTGSPGAAPGDRALARPRRGGNRLGDGPLRRLLARAAQVTVRGGLDGRHLLTCNGVPVPLHPVRAAGTRVAGVRFRAWAPYSALHPTIGVQSPLVFDLVDRWSGRSLGGCTYHVVHQGGLAFERMPVNAAEAESRRAARFRTDGHTPGPVDPDLLARADVAADRGPEYRVTLDLRRASR